MDVTEFLSQSHYVGDIVTVSGWLTTMDDDSVLLAQELSDDWTKTPRINLQSQDIAFALLPQVWLIGGGPKSLFHSAVLRIKLLNTAPLKIEIQELRITYGAIEGHEVPDLGKEMIEKGKLIGPRFFSGKDEKFSGDWMDY
jgi:hypothetical protein